MCKKRASIETILTGVRKCSQINAHNYYSTMGKKFKVKEKKIIKRLKTIIMPLLVFGLLVGIAGNGQVSSAKTITKEFVDASLTNPGYAEIKNINVNNAVNVTYSVTPKSSGVVIRVEIYKYSDYSGTLVSSGTFAKGNSNTKTFSLPANKTYYAKITPTGGVSYVSGTFNAEY